MTDERRQTLYALAALVLGLLLLAVAEFQHADPPRWQSTIGPH